MGRQSCLCWNAVTIGELHRHLFGIDLFGCRLEHQQIERVGELRTVAALVERDPAAESNTSDHFGRVRASRREPAVRALRLASELPQRLCGGPAAPEGVAGMDLLGVRPVRAQFRSRFSVPRKAAQRVVGA